MINGVGGIAPFNNPLINKAIGILTAQAGMIPVKTLPFELVASLV